MPEFVTQREFFERLNTYVFVPNFGHRIGRQKMRDVIGGIADVIAEIVLDGGSVRFGKLGTFKLHIRSAGKGWDPKRKRHIKCPEKKKIVFRLSKSTTRLFRP